MTEGASHTSSRDLTVKMNEDGSITFGSRRFRVWVESERSALAEVLFTEAFKWHAFQAQKAKETERTAINNDAIAEALRRSASAEQRSIANAMKSYRVKHYTPQGKRILTDEEMEDILNDIEI